MASLPLSARPERAHARRMALGILIFFLLITVASIAGKTADTREYGDWKPTNGGFRET